MGSCLDVISNLRRLLRRKERGKEGGTRERIVSTYRNSPYFIGAGAPDILLNN